MVFPRLKILEDKNNGLMALASERAGLNEVDQENIEHVIVNEVFFNQNIFSF